MSATSRAIRGLYAVTPDASDTATLLARVAAALTGGARVVQYRDKASPASVRLAQAGGLRELCARHNALFIVNDDVALARAVEADGVHVGAHDASCAAARDVLGTDRIIGVSCYNELARAHAAHAAGADYVAFGSFFPSRVKPGAVQAPLALLQTARAELPLPIVAIGGITADNAVQLVDAGADALAVISALFDAPDVLTAAQRFSVLFERTP